MKMLRTRRKECGLTMKELGERIGVTESAISQYENGKRQASYEIQLKLAETLNCSIDYLLRGNEKVPATENDDGQISKIVHVVGNLNPENQNKVAVYARKLAEIQQMQEAADDSLGTK